MIHPNRLTRFPSRLAGLLTARAAAAVCAAVAGGLLGLAGCAGSSGSAEVAGVPQALPAPGFAREWATVLDLKNDEVDRLFVRDELLFVYTKKGSSYVLSRDSGGIQHLEAVPGGNYRLRPPVVLPDRILYPTTSDIAVYNRQGQPLRTIDVGGAFRSNAVVGGRSVFIAVDSPNGGSRVAKIDVPLSNANDPNLPSGKRSWELQAFRGGMSAAPAVQADAVYAADESGLVYAVTADGREPIWPISNPPFGNTFDARSPVTADVIADETGVYVATAGEGKLYCLSRNTGQVRWQYFGSGALTATPVVTPDTVYVLDPNRGMVALNKGDAPDPASPQFNRTPRWTQTGVRQILAQDDKYTYGLRNDNVIVALDKQTGAVEFVSRRKDLHAFATNAKDGTLYAATKGGRVLAVKPVFQAGQVGEVVDASGLLNRADTPRVVADAR